MIAPFHPPPPPPPRQQGTAGIHALTLLGRKVQGGAADILFDEMRAAADAADAVAAARADDAAALGECAASLRAAVARAAEVTATLTAADDPRAALVNAHDYLTLFGHTVAAWTWLRLATAAAAELDALAADRRDGADALFLRGKLHTCRFFFRHELPKTETLAALLLTMDPTVAEMEPGLF